MTATQIELDYQRTAAFDVDAQKTFTPLLPNELPVPGGERIAQALNAQAAKACIRVGSKDVHGPDPAWLTRDPGQIGQPTGIASAPEYWVAHAQLGTEGVELLDGLPHPQQGYNFFIYKGIEPDQHPYGAVYHDIAESQSTGVIEYLREQQITDVLVGGLALDFCVQATARQLQQAGFQVWIHASATAPITPDGGKQARQALEALGVGWLPSEVD